MILYATQRTIERYKLLLSHELPYPSNEIAQAIVERESGDRLLEWGASLFYLYGKKCIQVVNFAAKLTLFLPDIRMSDLPNLGSLIFGYVCALYDGDKPMQQAIEKMGQESSVFYCGKLTDKSISATIKSTHERFIVRNFASYLYPETILSDPMMFNTAINHWSFPVKIDGRIKYRKSLPRFRELMLARYGLDRGAT